MKVYWCTYGVEGIFFFMPPSIRITAISAAEAELAATGRLRDNYAPRKVSIHKVREDEEESKKLQFTLN